ncbi:WD40-repeat-containing domain protein [Melampsora americana]|nr:WD40-repeat-containing domain protein [Melampsora americana]
MLNKNDMELDKSQSSSLQQISVLQGHSDRAWSVSWHPSKPIIASSSTDKQIKLYRFQSSSSSQTDLNLTHEDRKPMRRSSFRFDYLDSIPTGHTRTVRSIQWNPSGNLLASGSFDSTVSIWSNTHPFLDHDLPINKDRWESEIEAEQQQDSDSQNDTTDWECMMSLEGHESEIKGVAWNRNGKLMATCSRDKSVWVWEILTDSEADDGLVTDEGGYEVLSVLMEHEADVKSVCWSPKEDLLCSTSYDNHLHLYAEDLTSDGDFTLIHKLMGHTSTVWDASFSPCGELISSFSKGGIEGRDGGLSGGWRIGRSERERWSCVYVLEGFHKRTIYSVDWTLFGKVEDEIKGEEGEHLGYIATGGGDGKINIFTIHRGTSVSGLDSTNPKPEIELLTQQKNSHGVTDINSVRWCKIQDSSNSNSTNNWRPEARQLLASVGDDGLTKVWRLNS